MGMKIFQDARVDVAVVETGIGGRTDATNIFPFPVASIVTAIGHDHQEVLGETLPEITFEETGIWRVYFEFLKSLAKSCFSEKYSKFFTASTPSSC
jgi:folylpolyglutamate synthase/dihydropteroate synthase